MKHAEEKWQRIQSQLIDSTSRSARVRGTHKDWCCHFELCTDRQTVLDLDVWVETNTQRTFETTQS